MQDTFEVSAMVWTSGYEDSESWDLDCNGKTVIVSQSVCRCDDRRSHGHEYLVGNKAEILRAERVIEELLTDLNEMDKGGVYIRTRPSWYNDPHWREKCEDD